MREGTVREILMFDVHGHSPEHISNALGISKDVITAIQKSPLYQSEYATLLEEKKRREVDAATDAAQILAREAIASARKLAWIRDNAGSENVQRLAAVDILDRAGYGKVVRAEVTHNVLVRTDDLKRMDETFEMLQSDTGKYEALVDNGKPIEGELDDV